ncbi:interferon-induced very large GTPase 1-like [Dendronephthya gigantea]|uniref:interferon-induced very large GTPase 1-like n=1 Tax=Dendronephthya gigantea TaxID=151771 RepID=UPI001069E1E2|nr:interferon-induced very large GTPase 1-like [Dendronephthya gigantea]
MSLEAVAKLHQEYRDALVRFKKENKQTSPNSDEKKYLKQLEDKIAQSSFGLEHITRELPQLYQLENTEFDYAGAAAEILLSGLPLELLDGDSSYMPLRWFNAVYSKLVQKTNDAKIFVISVLGIQSSGKSTLLNTMFGLELPVSAGRCTRSAFASLIPVSDSLKAASKFNYLLIIDTEGLKGSGDHQLREHDNELATFAIGVADLTIVNIFGENQNDMKQFLEIAVHAFLKMRLASKKKTCKIVHQNVAATDATDKLVVDRSNLKLDLDRMTKIAAIQETCEHEFEKLDDVISFNENEDVFYIPNLLKGSPPMAPVNPEYGRAVQRMKDSIISYMCSKEIFRHSFSQFRDRVCALWKAMLKENFIFSFRNIMEVKAFTSLDRKYFQEFVKLMVIGMTDLERKIETALKRCSTREDRIKEWSESKQQIPREAEDIGVKMKEVMENFIDNSEDKAILEQWREYIINKINQHKEMQAMEISKNCTSAFNYLQNRQDAAEEERIYKEKLIRNARKFITSARDTEDSEKCKAAFDKEWQQWIVCVPQFQERQTDIENEMLRVLCDTDAHLHSEMNEKLRMKNSSVVAFKEPVPMIDVGQIYDSNRSKVDQDQHAIISSARSIRDKAIDEALKFVRATSRAGVRCTRNDLTQLYHKVVTTIEEESKFYSLRFFNGLRCDILLYIFGSTYEMFAQMEERYLEERDIRGNLERTLRPKLEAHFLNLCKKMRKEVLAATSFVDVLKNPIQVEINKSMGPAVAKEVLKKSMFQSKGQFHANVLIQLGEEGKLEPYIPYLSDPVNFLKKKLRQSIQNYCLNKGNVSINLLLKILWKSLKLLYAKPFQKPTKKRKPEVGT